jgi:hypothetical protein
MATTAGLIRATRSSSGAGSGRAVRSGAEESPAGGSVALGGSGGSRLSRLSGEFGAGVRPTRGSNGVVEVDRDTGAALLLRTYQMPLRKPPPASASTRMSSKRRDRLTGRPWVVAGRSVSVGADPAWTTPQRHESTLFGTRRPHF